MSNSGGGVLLIVSSGTFCYASSAGYLHLSLISEAVVSCYQESWSIWCLGDFQKKIGSSYGHNIMSYHCTSCSFCLLMIYSLISYCHVYVLCNIYSQLIITHSTLVGLVTTSLVMIMSQNIVR